MSQVEHARIPNESVFLRFVYLTNKTLHSLWLFIGSFSIFFLFFETSIYFASGFYKVEIRNRKCGDFVLSFG